MHGEGQRAPIKILRNRQSIEGWLVLEVCPCPSIVLTRVDVMTNASEVAAALSAVADDNPSPTEILMAGLFYVGYDQNRQTRNNLTRKTKWFKTFYGVEPATVADHFSELKSIDATVICKHYLLTMNWLYLYDSYPILSGRWNYSEEMIGRTVMRYGMLMATVGRRNIVFELEHNVALGRTVDCSTFMVQEMRLDPSARWFDFKTNSCGLVSISISIATFYRRSITTSRTSLHRNMSSVSQRVNQELFRSVVPILHRSTISQYFAGDFHLIETLGIEMHSTSNSEWEKSVLVIAVTLESHPKSWWKSQSIIPM